MFGRRLSCGSGSGASVLRCRLRWIGCVVGLMIEKMAGWRLDMM